MIMRCLHILGLLAMLIQCSPLRTCVVEQAMTGSSCHSPAGEASHDGAVEVANIDACGSDGTGSHDPGCACARPKVPAIDRAMHAEAVAVLPFATAPLPFARRATRAWLPSATTLAASGPPPARCMPMLT